MTPTLRFTVFLLLTTFSLFAQNAKYEGRVEIGYMNFLDVIVNYDPDPGWKGYHLSSDGVSINIINAIAINPHFSLGVGTGYSNFNGYSGINLFGDIEYKVLKSRFTPLMGVQLGYNHLWNQYDGGNASGWIEAGAGVNYQISDRFGVYVRSGIMTTQAASLIPIRVGVRF